MVFQLQYRFAIKEAATNTQDETPTNKVDNLCRLLENSGHSYIELIFGKLFNALKTKAFEKLCNKLYWEDSGTTYYNYYLQARVPRQMFHNKCPICDKKYKSTLGKNYYSFNYVSKTYVEPVNSGWQPSKLLWKHLEKKHNLTQVCVEDTKTRKYFTGVSLYYKYLTDENLELDRKKQRVLWRGLGHDGQRDWTKKAKEYNAKYLNGKHRK